MSEGALLARVEETLLGYLALGCRVEERRGWAAVRRPECPAVYDANFACRVRARTPGEIEALLADVDRVFAAHGHRQFVLDRATAPGVEARLDLLGYRENATVELLLEGELRARPRPCAIRPAEDEADWQSLARLKRADDVDRAGREGREPWDETVSAQLAAARRAKAPELRFFLAREDGRDCAYFSAWPGRNGVGKVEDLFTLPEFRRRGLATALIAHAVADARARGAGPVVIGAAPDDTPMQMYAALGFRPFCVSRTRLRTGAR